MPALHLQNPLGGVPAGGTGNAAAGMGAGAGEPEAGDWGFILRGADQRPEEQHLLGGEFAMMPVAADEAVLLLEIFGGEEFGLDDELADARRMVSSSCHDASSGRRRGPWQPSRL